MPKFYVGESVQPVAQKLREKVEQELEEVVTSLSRLRGQPLGYAPLS